MNVTRSLLEDIKTKQLQWYGHVQRMKDGRLAKEVIKWRPPGRRKRGRPKVTWTEGIRKLMGENYLIVKWAQEDVETIYNLLNKYHIFFFFFCA
jgi:hypothetical protein